MIRRRFLTAGTIGFVALVAGTDSVIRAATGDPRFPATIASRIGGKPVRLVLTGTALRKKYGFSVYTSPATSRRAPGSGTPTGLPHYTCSDSLQHL